MTSYGLTLCCFWTLLRASLRVMGSEKGLAGFRPLFCRSRAVLGKLLRLSLPSVNGKNAAGTAVPLGDSRGAPLPSSVPGTPRQFLLSRPVKKTARKREPRAHLPAAASGAGRRGPGAGARPTGRARTPGRGAPSPWGSGR